VFAQRYDDKDETNCPTDKHVHFGFIVAVSDVETGINDTMLLLLIRQEANKWKMEIYKRWNYQDKIIQNMINSKE